MAQQIEENAQNGGDGFKCSQRGVGRSIDWRNFQIMEMLSH